MLSADWWRRWFLELVEHVPRLDGEYEGERKGRVAQLMGISRPTIYNILDGKPTRLAPIDGCLRALAEIPERHADIRYELLQNIFQSFFYYLESAGSTSGSIVAEHDAKWWGAWFRELVSRVDLAEDEYDGQREARIVRRLRTSRTTFRRILRGRHATLPSIDGCLGALMMISNVNKEARLELCRRLVAPFGLRLEELPEKDEAEDDQKDAPAGEKES